MSSIDHISITVPKAKLEAEIAFLTGALAHTGFKEHFRVHPAVVGLGVSHPNIWVSSIDTEHNDIVVDEGTKILGIHLAFSAKDREEVDQFHKNALAAGGTCNGKPGPRPHYGPNYYGAFVLDPCGNNIEMVTRTPPPAEEAK